MSKVGHCCSRLLRTSFSLSLGVAVLCVALQWYAPFEQWWFSSSLHHLAVAEQQMLDAAYYTQNVTLQVRAVHTTLGPVHTITATAKGLSEQQIQALPHLLLLPGFGGTNPTLLLTNLFSECDVMQCVYNIYGVNDRYRRCSAVV